MAQPTADELRAAAEWIEAQETVTPTVAVPMPTLRRVVEAIADAPQPPCEFDDFLELRDLVAGA